MVKAHVAEASRMGAKVRPRRRMNESRLLQAAAVLGVRVVAVLHPKDLREVYMKGAAGCYAPYGLDRSGSEPAIYYIVGRRDRKVERDWKLFVLAHELGHALERHVHFSSLPEWKAENEMIREVACDLFADHLLGLHRTGHYLKGGGLNGWQEFLALRYRNALIERWKDLDL